MAITNLIIDQNHNKLIKLSDLASDSSVQVGTKASGYEDHMEIQQMASEQQAELERLVVICYEVINRVKVDEPRNLENIKIIYSPYSTLNVNYFGDRSKSQFL